MSKPSIAVIGAGIIGSAIAAELASQNQSVTVFQSDDDTRCVTPSSFGWINAHSPELAAHFKMRLASMQAWRSLIDKHPTIPVKQLPALDWDMPQEALEQTQRDYDKLGHDTRLVSSAEISNMFPMIEFSKDQAILSEQDMVANPVRIAGFFQDLARQAGAVFQKASAIETLEDEPNQTSIVYQGTKHSFDHIIIAAGRGSSELISKLGYALPMTRREGILLRSNPQPKVLNALISSPSAHFWQMDDGCLLAGQTQAGLSQFDNLDAFKTDMAIRVKSIIPQFENLAFEGHTQAIRPEPEDGMPVLDTIGINSNVHIAVMHSGITLAPFIAKEIANRVIKETPSQAMQAYSLDRFQHEAGSVAI